jgi:hypothetical protein
MSSKEAQTGTNKPRKVVLFAFVVFKSPSGFFTDLSSSSYQTNPDFPLTRSIAVKARHS